MPSLTELGNTPKQINIQGKAFTVRGISAESVLVLLSEYPELRLVLTGKAIDDPAAFIAKQGGKLLATVLVMGLGLWNSDDPVSNAREVEAAMHNLAIGDQVEILRHVVDKTLPKGPANFMEALSAIMAGADTAALTKDQVTK